MLNFNARGSYQQKLFWGHTIHQGRGACLLFHTVSGETEGHLHQTVWCEDLKRCLCRPLTHHTSKWNWLWDFPAFTNEPNRARIHLMVTELDKLTTRFRTIKSSSIDLWSSSSSAKTFFRAAREGKEGTQRRGPWFVMCVCGGGSHPGCVDNSPGVRWPSEACCWNTGSPLLVWATT